MKKIVLLIILIIACQSPEDKVREERLKFNKKIKLEAEYKKKKILARQINLKGITLGKIYEKDTILKTTVADLKGILTISLLKDKRPFKFTFKAKNLTNYEVQSFKLSIDNNYHKLYEKINGFQEFYTICDEVGYSLNINFRLNNLYDIEFIILDTVLEKLKNPRRKLKISNDF